MKIKTRLTLNTWISLSVIVLIACSLAWTFREVQRANVNKSLAYQMNKVQLERVSYRDDYLIHRGERARRQWMTATDILMNLLNEASGKFTDEEGRALLQEMRTNFNSASSIFREIIKRDQEKVRTAKENTLLDETDSRLGSQLSLKSYALQDGIIKLNELADREETKGKSKAFVLLILFLMVGIIAVVINSTALSRIVTRRLETLNEGIRIIGGGNLDYRLNVRGDDELSQLGRASNEMAAKLNESHTSVVNLQREVAERRKMEEALRQSELKYRTVANNTYDWEFWTKPEGRFVYCSPSCERLTGYSAEELMQDSDLLRSIIHTEDLATFDRHRQEEEEEEEEVTPQEIQFRIIHRDGSLRWIGHVCQRVFDEEGRFLGIRGNNRDITERKRMEEEVRDSEREFVTMFERSSVGKSLSDPATNRMLRVNEAFADMLGYTVEELSTMTFVDITHPDDRERDIAGYDLVRKGVTDKWQIEKRYIRKDGSIMWANTSGNIIRYEDGRPTRTLAVIQDITERKRTEEALQASEEKFSKAFRNSPNAITITRLNDGKIIEGNESAYELFGYTHEEVLGKTTSELGIWTNFDDRQRLLTGLASKGFIQNEEFVLQKKDKTTIYVNLSASLITIDNQQCFLCSFIDITEGKKAEEALRESEKKERERAAELAAILDTAPIPIFISHDTEGSHITGNPAAEEMLRIRRDELSLTAPEGSRPNNYRCVKAGRELVGDELPAQRAAKGLPVDNFDFDIVFDDGTIRHVVGNGKSLLDNRGRPRGSILAVADITEQKRAEEVLRESEERRKVAEALESERHRLYGVLETVPALVWLLTPDYHVAFANRAACEKFGEVRGRLCYEACFGLSTPCEFCQTYNVLKTGQPVRWEAHPPDGSVVYCHDFPFTDADGSPMILEMGIDITETKRTEEALNKKTAELSYLSSQLVTAQEKERKRVSYDLHDDVWQMLVAIRFEIERLFSGNGKKDWAVLESKSKEVLEHMRDAVGKIRSMQGDLWPYVLDDIGILSTIDWYCREFKKSHSGLTIDIKNDLNEHEVPSSAKIVVYRLLQETLDNIAKYSQASHVTLGLQKKDHGFEFVVKDNGAGFDLEETMVRKNPWGSLGLLTLKGRVELSGGRFEIESARGKGTTIRAVWPL